MGAVGNFQIVEFAHTLAAEDINEDGYYIYTMMAPSGTYILAAGFLPYLPSGSTAYLRASYPSTSTGAQSSDGTHWTMIFSGLEASTGLNMWAVCAEMGDSVSYVENNV